MQTKCQVERFLRGVGYMKQQQLYEILLGERPMGRQSGCKSEEMVPVEMIEIEIKVILAHETSIGFRVSQDVVNYELSTFRVVTSFFHLPIIYILFYLLKIILFHLRKLKEIFLKGNP